MFEYFPTTGFKKYLKQARAILEGNWLGEYTRPAPGLYPHQWNWDSGFIAMGHAHYKPERGMSELRHLFGQQWPSGMLPHIVFNMDALGGYFPEPDFWQAPDGRPTSGITMPPLHASACLLLYQKTGDRGFLQEMFPKLFASHRYFYKWRDPERVGLVYIRHPWESGLDNSPSWDAPLAAMHIDRRKLPNYQRKDLGHGVPSEQRPTDDNYDRYVYLVDLFRLLGYDEEAIYQECPFLVQDVLLNSILSRANYDLLEIAGIIGQDPGQVIEWADTTAKAIGRHMWNQEQGQFDPWCLRAKQPLVTATAASFMPLYGLAASQEQAQIIYQRMDSLSFCALNQGNCFTIPNFDMQHQKFDSRNYWRGPVWLNINWMLSKGLSAYGFRAKSDAMKKDLIQLPVRFGFHEYFDSKTGQGYGSGAFSWSAALFIDLVGEYYDQDRGVLGWLGGKSRSLAAPLILNRGEAAPDAPPPDLAARLMAAISELKRAFYDISRGRVDYQAMKGSEQYAAYQRLTAGLAGFELQSLGSHEERLAFWINLYNTMVVHGIVELGIQDSVREVKNFFSAVSYEISGLRFSLDEIEHGILRSNARPPHRVFHAFAPWDQRRKFALAGLDARIHFALVCGSRSCAPIEFYAAARISRQLDEAADGFVNSSEVVILPEKNTLMLSQIFNWYAADFGGKGAVVDFVMDHLRDKDKAAWLARRRHDLEIEYLFYDWNLNH